MMYKELFNNYTIENPEKQIELAKKVYEAFELICIHDINYLKVIGGRGSGKTLLLRMIIEKLMIDFVSAYKITQKQTTLDIIAINNNYEQLNFITSTCNSTTTGNTLTSNNHYGPGLLPITRAKSISIGGISNLNPLIGYSPNLILLDECAGINQQNQSCLEMSILGTRAKCIYIENQRNRWCLPCDFEVEL